MKFGLALSSQHAPGDDLGTRWKEHLERVRLAKALGFSSVSATQHYVSPPHQSLQPIPLLSRIVDETFLLEAEEIAKDRFIVGDPAAVCDEIERYRERLGLETIVFRVQRPGMDAAEVLRTLRLLGEEVLPRLQ